jgi:uncharacterized membrane-anchored protein YitT (DUF2179 family)
MIAAFFILGRDMAIKTFVGSLATTLCIGVAEKIIDLNEVIIQNNYLSAFIGAGIIAIASGIMFYVDSSSGGTDIIALIVKKYSTLKIGKALLATDLLIVVIGGILSGWEIALSSLLGLLVKTFGIDFVIYLVKRFVKIDGEQENVD